jgi:cytochrome P450
MIPQILITLACAYLAWSIIALEFNYRRGEVTGLTVKEIYGNFFAINFSGYNPTAKTLAYAILMLTAHPEVQDWVAEELRELVPADGYRSMMCFRSLRLFW